MKKKTTQPKVRRKQMYLHHGPGGTLPKLARRYDDEFQVTPEYRETLPDMMEAAGPGQGANVPIQQVGVSNFRLPLPFKTRAGKSLQLEAAVTGTVSLAANLRGINMSRIVRSFYDHREESFTPATLGRILGTYRRTVEALAARLKVTFSYPILQPSLRSGLEGYQYYTVSYEAAVSPNGRVRTWVEFDFVYSSACPCSAELSEHARETRGAYAIPHNQRSKARVRVELAPRARVTVEDLQALCLQALKTETQVMVKREDEQAFAELNGAHIKFVEDAARLLYEVLVQDRRFVDFQVACSHLESLHSHDAVSVICKGVRGGMTAEFMDFRQLVC